MAPARFCPRGEFVRSAFARLTASCVSASTRPSPLPRPSGKRFRERGLSGRTLFDREDRAPTVVVDDRDVEPGALLQELHVALKVGFDGRQSNQKIPVRDFDRLSSQRNAKI